MERGRREEELETKIVELKGRLAALEEQRSTYQEEQAGRQKVTNRHPELHPPPPWIPRSSPHIPSSW